MCIAFSKINGIELILGVPSHLKVTTPEDYNFKIEKFNPCIKNQTINRYFNYYSVRKLIRNTNPDIIFTRDPVLLISCVNTPARLIFESHNSLLHNGSKIINQILRKLLLRVSRNKNFILFISISKNLKNFWKQKGVNENKLLALHDGFTEEHFSEKINPHDTRAMLNLPVENKIAMYVGSLYSDREISSIITLAKDFPLVFFVIVGGPEDQVRLLEKDIRNLGLKNILMTGPLPHNEVPEYLFAADILLALWSDKVKTINYCSPLKLFEYMAAGKTILAHAFPTIKEVLTHNQTALLVEPNSYDDLKNKFEDALALPNNQLGENARLLAFEKYTWSIRVNKILEKLKN